MISLVASARLYSTFSPAKKFDETGRSPGRILKPPVLAIKNICDRSVLQNLTCEDGKNGCKQLDHDRPINFALLTLMIAVPR